VDRRARFGALWWLRHRAPSVALAALLFLAGVLAATTDGIVLWFHVTFAVLMVSSLVLEFRTVALQAVVWVPVTVITVSLAVWEDKTQSAELAELPLLTASLGAVLVVSHRRTAALAELRRTQVALEAHHQSERERLEQQLAQAQAADAVGRLAAGVAHDLSNVLTAILGHAEDLTDVVDDECARAHAGAIETAVHRSIALIDDLMSLSRGDDGRPVAVVDVNAVVATVVEMLRPLIGEDISVTVNLHASPCTVRSQWSRLERIVVNLVVNAREALVNCGELTVSTEVTELAVAAGELEPGQYTAITVADTGSGINLENIDHIFDPFFSTKKRAGGTGIGLSTVRDIARHAGGAVQIESSVNGTIARVLLPFVADSATGTRELRDVGPAIDGAETVLVVEDDEHVRHRVHGTLERSGYHVLDAASAEAALTLADEYAGAIDLLLSDVVLPGMNGPQLAHEMRVRRPSVEALLMSGYDDVGAAESAHFLRKPIRRKELLAAVHDILHERPSRPPSGSTARSA
jgi:signal transduction histidine kinase/ActR/RegA family two-component response regulator